ncbi:MAG: BlaI/MecI/CopY family transcriptional regulator [Actinomycetota bacterium]|nr:BlaI/MecI/CopY family transcriptional regulator [Actinomycetota bacterium]
MNVAERRPRGSLEADVLAQLWVSPDGATTGEVLARLDSGLAYTTVMTILLRLWKKGLVERHRRGRGYAYRALVTEADLAADRMRSALEQVKDREQVFSSFVGGLSKKEERTLRRVLGELDQ